MMAVLLQVLDTTIANVALPHMQASLSATQDMINWVMIGPILGPVLGGWLTDNYNWRWVFLVNLPVGAICALLMLRFMPKTEIHDRKIDLFGFALLGIGLAALQLFLDRGQQNDWFQSWETIIELSVAIAAFWMFAVQMVTAKHPLFDRSMFADRNFAAGLIFMAAARVLPP